MSVRKARLTLDCEVERIPDGDVDTPEFVEWCQLYGIYPLKGARRGWWSGLGTYIRDASYLVFLAGDSGGTILMTKEEFEKSKSE